MNEQELKDAEERLKQKEQELDQREKKLDSLSAAVDEKKQQLYGKIPVTKRQVDIILWLACGALAVVVVLIILEATGIYKIG